MENKYVEIIKKIIANKAKEYSIANTLTNDYFNNLITEIRAAVQTVIRVYGYPEIDDTTLENYYETARKEYLSVYPVNIDVAHALTKKGFKTWLTALRKNEIAWHYSDRYFTHLENSGRSEKVVQETKDSSMEILEKMGDPKSSEAFYCKGLVVGSVQAGKTQNFNAVINRAIDAGYGLVIVLAGLMEDLRTQTQLRIENDVVGDGFDIDSGSLVTKGVGKIRRFGIRGDTDIGAVVSVTSSKSDFKKSLLDADFSLNHTNILVCKNNVSVLRNLIVWLHDYLEAGRDQHDIPLLVLDDEADNASLNNEGKKGREYASRTNGHIRALLELFKRKTYLGYTATPFANILADRNEAPENRWPVKYKLKGQPEEKQLRQVDNLFPDDFIVLLNPPSNYIGAKQIFETLKPIENKAQLKIPLVEVVNDYLQYFPDKVYPQPDGRLIGVLKINNKTDWEERFGIAGTYLDFSDYADYRRRTRSPRPVDDFPEALPESIKDSILCFILSIAIRESRKPAMIHSALFQPHNSMLIHISRFTMWQNRLKDLIDSYLEKLQADIELDDPSKPNSIFSTFERVWYQYYASIVDQIADYLPKDYEDEFLIPISYESVKNKYLIGAIKDIEVKAINSTTGDQLTYPPNSPKKYIAIGGNRLSRGFTLEGLSINYFVRPTDYSDALLQMGRWFGYRPGYLDCCKLFITEESVTKYDLVTRTIEELETEFRKMEEKDKTPSNFILRVKKHPGALKITRPAILRDTVEVNWSYQDTLEQTTKFNVSKEKMEKVWADFLTKTLKRYEFNLRRNNDGSSSGFLTAETDIDGILQFLKEQNNFGAETCDSICKFIELCKRQNLAGRKKVLNSWTIAIKTTGRASSAKGKGKITARELNLPKGMDIELTVRRGPGREPAERKYREDFLQKKIFGASGKSANLISGGNDLSLLLSEAQKEAAVKEFLESRMTYYRKNYPNESDAQILQRAKSVSVPERVFREKMSSENGLLLIYLLDSYYVFRQEKDDTDEDFTKVFIEQEKIDLEVPLVGYAIGFPPIEPDPGGVYVHGDYGIEDEDELDPEDSQLPLDANEA